VPLGQAVNQGQLLIDAAARDPYARALEPLVERLGGAATAAQACGKSALGALKRFIPTSTKRS